MSSQQLPVTGNDSFDVVVVGGGLVGAAAAYACACSGQRTVLVERHELSSGASGANFGNIQVSDCEYGLSLQLTLDSFRRHGTLEQELDWDLGYRSRGYLLLVENEAQRALMVEREARLQAAGLEVQYLGHDDLGRLEPNLAPETYLGALYNPKEAQLNPFQLVRAYVARGQEQDLEVRLYTTVTGLQMAGGRVTGVETTRGSVAAGSVVLCTGAWTRGLGQRFGLDLPLQWVHGEAVVTEPLPPLVTNGMVTAGFFEVMHVDAPEDHPEVEPQDGAQASEEPTVGFCLTTRPHGQLMVGETSIIVDETQTRNYSTTGGMPAVALEAVRRIPRLAQVKLLRTWAASILFTGDNRPLLGPVDGFDGLFLATGLKSTIILTPVVGQLVADMVAGREVDARLAEFAPGRLLG
jgi:sarcosine oxidase subunit beta